MGVSRLVEALESGQFFRSSFKGLLYIVGFSTAIYAIAIVYSQFIYANNKIVNFSNEAYISILLSIIFVVVSLMICGLLIHRARRCSLSEEYAVTALTIIMIRLVGEVVAIAQFSYVVFIVAIQFDGGAVYESPISEAFLAMPGVAIVHIMSTFLFSLVEAERIVLVMIVAVLSIVSAWVTLWLAYAISESMLLFKKSADNLGIIAKSNIHIARLGSNQ